MAHETARQALGEPHGSEPLPRTAEVVVIGGGVIGASTAFHLAEAGVRDVLVLERDTPASGSSGKPIGGVRAQFSDPLNIRLGQRSLRAWREFGDRPGADVGLDRVGYLFLLRRDEDVAAFREATAVQRELGVDSRLVRPREAHRLCPFLDPDAIIAAAHSPDDGFALPGPAVLGYLRAARGLGARVRTHCAVTGFERDGEALTAVRTTAGTVRTGTVVCAAGAWSGEIAALAGLSLPVVPLRRQIALTGPVVPAPPRIPFTLDFTSTLYFHGDNAGGLVLGLSDPRQEPGFGREFTEEWLEPFRAAATRVAPALAELEPAGGGWAGLYEMTPDRNALIGEAPGARRFLYATGFSGHGFLQAPAVGEIVRDLYLGREPFLDVGPLAATRFAPAGSRATARPEAHII
ncbi:NAD(P)/FAD-dependent oxidoreductase [Streptomyces sp. NPDC059011]|uniref:NAD(P)/FAD-dependent oxidoreductase n=1 Tax=unclassified Streptomyces TaxID=2593676 RepID=UPI0036AE0CC2